MNGRSAKRIADYRHAAMGIEIRFPENPAEFTARSYWYLRKLPTTTPAISSASGRSTG